MKELEAAADLPIRLTIRICCAMLGTPNLVGLSPVGALGTLE